ncbi:hypothetical protein D3C72_1894370 [compost metagenome]
MQVFTRHAEQVALIVGMHPAVGLHQQETVNRALGGFQRHATANQRVVFVRPTVQPVNHLLFRQRTFPGIHGKTGSKHLRQYDQIAAA